MKRDPLLGLILIITALMIYATLYPFHLSPVQHGLLVWHSARTRGDWMDVLLNIYFFVPLGLCLGMRFRSRGAMILSLLGCVLLTTSIETAQSFLADRHSSLRDVLLNSVGAGIGLICAHLPMLDPEALAPRLRPLFAQRASLILGACYVVYLFFPFIPSLQVASILRFRHALDVAVWPLDSMIEGACFAYFASFLLDLSSARIPIALFLLAPAKILLWGRFAQPHEVVAPMIGFAVAILTVTLHRRPNAKVCALTAIALLLYRQLQPFEWLSTPLQEFRWIPFLPMLEHRAVEILALKCFLYWYTTRACAIAFQRPAWHIAFPVAGFLFVTELAQVYAPGRTPELTDPLLALIPAWPLLKFDQGLNRAAR